MVFLHFPTSLTEEEQMLQAKYLKLRKKKKALHTLKTPTKEVERPFTLKRPSDIRDAREIARKLIKSGAISAIQKEHTKQDQTFFKRPKGQDRKGPAPDSTVSVYQPFSSTPNGTAQTTVTNDLRNEETCKQNLKNNSVIEREPNNRDIRDKNHLNVDKRRAGNTIFVSGNQVDEDFLRETFSDYGTIINVSMEIEKGHGFLTFANPESADRAIFEMESKNVNGIRLQVQLARRQPQVELINSRSSSAVWSSIAVTKSQKGSHKDRREMVQYDEDFLL